MVKKTEDVSPSAASYRKGIVIFVLLLAVIVYAGVRIHQASTDLNQEYERLLESPALRSD